MKFSEIDLSIFCLFLKILAWLGLQQITLVLNIFVSEGYLGKGKKPEAKTFIWRGRTTPDKIKKTHI